MEHKRENRTPPPPLARAMGVGGGNMGSFLCILLVSCYCRYCCSYCEVSVSVFGRHERARISTLYGFNTVVVGLLQIVVLMNEAFPFDSMLFHGVHSFPHWMTR